MKTVIIGAGRTGESIVKNLSDEKHDIVLMDIDGDRIKELVDRYDIRGVIGGACVEENLAEAGAATADLLIAVTNKDEINILSCIIGKALGAKNLIAQVRNPDYYRSMSSMMDKFGIDMFINPEAALAEEISKILRFPSAVKVSSFSGGRVDIAELKITGESKICGKTLLELKENSKIPFLIAAIERDDSILIPSGSTMLDEGDIISVCAKHEDLRAVFSYFGFMKHRVQTVIIIGSDNESYYLARSLLQNGSKVKIIGRNKEKCVEIKSKLPEAEVICGDFTNKAVLERENIDLVDAAVAASSYDENNIVISLYAKSRSVPRVVTVIRGDSYGGILSDINLDAAISPYELTGAQIARYVRSVDVPVNSQIISMNTVCGGMAEALEFNIGSNEKYVGKNLKELRGDLKDGVLFLAITRKRSSIIPDGSTVLEEGDRIIVMTASEKISKIEDLLR